MSLRVLFRVGAGPRVGFGHLLRAGTLADALRVRPVVSVRGGRSAATVASRLGFTVAGTLAAALRSMRPTLLVVDDPSRSAARRAVRSARRLGVPAASVHDLGLAPCGSDLSIDGSIAPGPMDLAGVRFAVLHPQLRGLAARRRRTAARTPNVVVAFGGGPRRRLAAHVVDAIARRRPNVRIDVAEGFRPGRRLRSRREAANSPRSFRSALAGATVAVLAGGVTLYEACALGVPAVGVSVVDGQRRSIAGLARRGAVVDAGHARSAARTAARAARLVDELLDSPERLRQLSKAGRGLVDGRGAARVASALRSLAERTSVRRRR